MYCICNGLSEIYNVFLYNRSDFFVYTNIVILKILRCYFCFHIFSLYEILFLNRKIFCQSFYIKPECNLQIFHYFVLLVLRRFPIALANAAGPAVPLAIPSPQPNNVASTTTVRKYFPETWIWSCDLSGLV